MTALALGGLAFLNTWDFPIYLGLFAAAVVLNAFLLEGWRFELGLEFLTVGVSLGLAGIALYLPFYLTFASQANGFLPSLIFFTRGVHFWIMFGVLLLPILAWLVWTWTRRGSLNGMIAGGSFAVVVIGGLWLLSILYGFFRLSADPTLAGIWGALNGQGLILASVIQRAASPGTWLALLVLITLAWGLLYAYRFRIADIPGPASMVDDPDRKPAGFPDSFVLLLFMVGVALVVFPEFFYLRDQFGYRMNTIFKFYFQSWIIWGLVAGYGSAVLLQEMRGSWRFVFYVAWALLVIVALPYSYFGIGSRTNMLQPAQWSLDGAAYIQNYAPEEMDAIHWLQQAPYGVVAEAIGGSYTSYARVSTNSGLPTVLGWPGHESQWRGGAEEMGSREPDIASLFRTKDWAQASKILQKYSIRYIYVGPMERREYRPNESLFQQHMSTVFHNNSVTIYEYQLIDSQQGQALNP
ncbi:MAG: hypothetical protein IH586_06640 [Anaerolineaceae bacterium]|nr:hypothetical protein [Anaerolineaceae bacterium]